MHKFFTQPEYISDKVARIIGDDVKHIYKVLRLTEGSEVIVNNSLGKEYLCKISSITKTEVEFDILEEVEKSNESSIEITLFQGLPKSQKMDLIVQKGTELGVFKFVPVITERVDVKIKGEFKKLSRLSKIALEAAKQSKRSIIPEVTEPIEFDDAIKSIQNMDLFVVPYENSQNYGINSLIREIKLDEIKKVGIMIGPEGGFEEVEIEALKNNGAKIVTLGNRILRTETAGFVAASLIQYELGDLGGVVR